MVSSLFAQLLLAASVSASVLPRDHTDGASGRLSFPITRVRRDLPLSRRDTNVPVLNQTSVSYEIDLDIGTPPQRVRVSIDTGSSELWVNPNCARVETAAESEQCVRDGRYDPRRSSSAQISQTTNELRYGKGQAVVQYVSDKINVPQSTVQLNNVVFGAALDSQELSEGIMGLSFGVGYNMRYNNFVDELALQGVTNSRAFSVALGSKAENNGGMIIFGGMDLKKFRGPLFRSAILPPQGDDLLHRYYVTMESVGLTPSGSPTRTLVPSNLTVVLDTGATLSYLPGNLAAAVAAEVGAYIFPGDESQTYVIDCGATKSDTAVEFKFEGGATIRVPMHEMVWELALEPDSLPNGAPPVCVWGIQSGDQLGISLLGDTFLRSAYVVFDQDSNAIFMAQYENCGSREVTIPAGRDAVANFTGECTTAGASAARKNAGARTSFSTAAPWIAATAAVAGVQLLLGLA